MLSFNYRRNKYEKSKLVLAVISIITALVLIFNTNPLNVSASITPDTLMYASGNNTIYRHEVGKYRGSYFVQAPDHVYIIKGTQYLSGTTIYNAVLPLTLAQGNMLASVWNNGKPNQVLRIYVYEYEGCRFNPDYCRSLGYSGVSRYLGYELTTDTSIPSEIPTRFR